MRDVILSQILREYFSTVTAEMNGVMDRTALSPMFNEAHDCSAGLFFLDEGEVSLIARAQAEPVHIYASLYSTIGLVDYWQDDLHPGDIVVVNDPYMYGTHLPDWTVMMPVFFEGKPIFFPCVRGHIIEHGCTLPGGLDPSFRDIWQESIRFMPLKLYARGEEQTDVLDWIMANNRQPAVTRGDLNAMVGACKIGARRVLEIVEKYGVAKVVDGVERFLGQSEQQVRARIAEWPDGEYSGRAIGDTDFAGNRDLNIDCTIRVAGDELEVDFAGTHEQVTGHVNSTFGSTCSWVYTALSALMPDVPVNSGFFRPVRVLAPEGTVVNPLPPAPVASNTIIIGTNIGDAVMKAFEHIVPELVGSVACDILASRQFGIDGRHPERPYFVVGDYLLSVTMSSGAYGVDGWGAWSALHGSHRMPTVEMTEVQAPTLYLEAQYADDATAPGQWRGLPGFRVRKQSPPDDEASSLTLYVQSQHHPLPGWAGGAAGASTYAVLDYGGPNERRVEEFTSNHRWEPGEVLFVRKGGGGGWGDPLDRDPELVLMDVLDEYVPLASARADYGVVIDEMAVDREATERLRRELREAAAKEAGE